MTRTADQIALLRTETAPVLLKELQGIQAGNEELRAGLLTAISQGLSDFVGSYEGHDSAGIESQGWAVRGADVLNGSW